MICRSIGRENVHVYFPLSFRDPGVSFASKTTFVNLVKTFESKMELMTCPLSFRFKFKDNLDQTIGE